jgi:hypothetical protein
LTQVLIGLDEFALTVLNNDFETAVHDAPGMQQEAVGPDLIYSFALLVTPDVSGIEGELLRKSLQEVLFQIAGTDIELTREQLADRLLAFLRRRGAAGLIRRFLALHVFNVVWFQTADSFRSVAWTPKSFVYDMERVERACQEMVRNVWRSLKITGPLDPPTAARLVDQLTKRLTNS